MLLLTFFLLVEEPTHPELKKELAAMVKADQEARTKMIERTKQGTSEKSGKTATSEYEAVSAIDAKNRARLRAIILEHGWPTVRMVGQAGAHNAWLLVQHCDADRPFQKECLQHLEKAVAAGEGSKTDLAYLTDRVLVGEGKPQRYGTQASFRDGKATLSEVEEPAKLDERRAAVGLGPIADYLRQLESIYGKSK